MASTSRTKNSSLNLVTTFGQQLLNMALRFLVRTVFVYTLGKSYLGINGLFSDILSMLCLAEFGFDTAINYKLYKPLVERDERAIRMYMSFFKKIYRMVSGVILGLGLLLIPALPVLIKDYDRLGELGINAVLIYIIYLLQSVSSYLFFAYRSAIVKADQKSYILNVVSGLVDIVLSFVQIAILLIWHNYIVYIMALIGFNIIRNLISARIATAKYPNYFAGEADTLSRQEIKEIFKDCSALFVFKVDNVIVKATDNLVLSSFRGLAMVGEYSTYLLIYTSLKGILNRMHDAVKASMGNLFAVEDIEHKYFFFETTNFITMILYGTAGGGIAIMSNELIGCWLGADYVIPQPLPLLIGIELLFVGIKINLNQIRNICGVFQQMWYRPLIGIVINLVVSVVGVFVWGINGVVLGTIMSLIFANFTVDPTVIHKYCFEGYQSVSRYYRRNFGYMAVLAVACAIAMWLCSHVFVGHGWFSVIVHSLICGILIPVAFFLVYRRTEECRYLIKKVQLMRSRRR
ncbi:MAG: hypothetical protein K2N81_11525 [Acetatifactor sp.]|nr:hypothetical protein [Acetatifactor sp.]